MLSRGPATPRVVTVAELLSRHAAPAGDAETPIVTVAGLLRREGRGPHAAGRPVQRRARAAEEETAAEPEGGIDRRTLVRRSAVAAGALLAVGSVFGAAVVSDATGYQPALADSYPGQGALDRAAPGPATILDDAARSTALDAGAPAITAWMSMAFPTSAAAQPAAPATARPAPDAPDAPQIPTPRAPLATAPVVTGGDAAPAAGTSAPRSDGGIVSRTGGTAAQVGRNTPLRPVTGAVGGTVQDLGRTVDHVASPLTGSASSSSSGGGDVLSSVGRAAGGLLGALGG